MKLIYRPTVEQDLPECLRLAFFGDPPVVAADRRLEAWCGLWSQGAANSAVIEDQERPAGRRIVHLGVSVFVTDEFVREARACPRPFLSETVLDRFLAGRSPVLDAAARRANAAGGLNLLILHQGMAADLRLEEHKGVLVRAPDTFFQVHQGFPIKEMLIQHPEAEIQEYLTASGWQWRDEATGLFGLTRAEAQARPGAYVARLFTTDPPRLGLRPHEQQLLQRALLGETDAEVSVALGLAPDTVKARWRALYDRVVARAPELLPETDSPEHKRGTEKRRRLLAYLRHHPEELRPL